VPDTLRSRFFDNQTCVTGPRQLLEKSLLLFKQKHLTPQVKGHLRPNGVHFSTAFRTGSQSLDPL
jgi:hypothetical protein